MCQADIQKRLQTLTVYSGVWGEGRLDAASVHTLQLSLTSKAEQARHLQSSVVRPPSARAQGGSAGAGDCYHKVPCAHRRCHSQAELEEELTQRRAELAKIKGLDSKLEGELRTITLDAEKLRAQLVVHRDLQSLSENRAAYEARLRRLQALLPRQLSMLTAAASWQHDEVQALADSLTARSHCQACHLPQSRRSTGVTVRLV